MVTRAGIYVRISDDREDTQTGVARQETDCRATASALGWDVTTVYAENDTSAFKRRKVELPDGTHALRVIRPEFRRMLADIAAGADAGGVDAVLGYDLDRVARDPRDLEDLIDVCETTGRPVRSVTGNLDLSHDGGVTLARVAVAMANQASRDTSRRVRRAKEANAAAGRWNGGGRRAYGYTTHRDAIIPEEAAVIREAAAWIIGGGSTRALLHDLNARGIPTVTGTPWSGEALRRLLLSGVAAGRLTHRGSDAGKASWPPILDEATWAAVVAEYASRPKRDATLRHWLTGMATCGRCGTRLRGMRGKVTDNRPAYAYVCHSDQGGCNGIWVQAHNLEPLVERALLARIDQVGRPTVPAPAPVPDDSQLVELAKLWARKEISLAEYRAARVEVTRQLQVDTPAAPRRLPAWAATADIPARWAGWEPMRKRTVAAGYIDAVIVGPSPTRRWAPDRVDIRWR